MDDVRIYNRALSAAEVAALYAGTKFTVTQQNLNSRPTSISVAKSYWADSSKWSGSAVTKYYDVIAFSDNDYSANFGTVSFPGNATSKADWYVVRCTGRMRIPSAGYWTFACGSDDGFEATISGNGLSETFSYSSDRAYAVTLKTIYFSTAGDYDLDLLYFEYGDRSTLEFSAAQGSYSSFSSSAFKLVGAADSPIQLAGYGWPEPSPLSAALNTTQWVTTGGDALWTVSADVSHDGVSSARSGACDPSKPPLSTMQTTVEGPAQVSFWWKVSSEKGWDWLSFKIDESEHCAISGGVNSGGYSRRDSSGSSSTFDGAWRQEVFTIPAGTHTLTWRYYSTDSVNHYDDDCGWVDQLVVNAGPYIVRYNKNDGSGLTATQSFEIGETKSLMWLTGGLGWSYSGYNFLGWSYSPTATTATFANGQSVGDLASSGQTVDLYAVLEPTTYTVRYNRNDGSGTTTSQTLTRGKSQNLLWMDSQIGWKVAGYTFGGWSRSATSKTVAYANGASVNNIAAAGASLDLFAIWTPSIAPATALDCAGRVFTLGGSALWYGQKDVTHDGKSAMRSGAVGHSQASWMETTVEGPVQVSFWWKVSSESGWDKLHFSVDGSEVVSCISGNRDWTQVTQNLGSGTHTLKWTYDRDGGGSSGSDCGWVDQLVVKPGPYTVQYHKNDGTAAVATQQMTPGEAQQLLYLSGGLGWSRTGFNFLGWSEYDWDDAVAYANGARVEDLASSYETKDLYAVWQYNGYTIRFHKNDGTSATVDRQILRGTSQALWLNAFVASWTRVGYTFAGWSRSASASTVTYANGASVKDIAAVGALVDFYAVWAPNTYTVRFHKNDGTTETRDQVFTYGKTQSLLWMDSQIGWKVSGCTFAGWSTTTAGAVSRSNGAKVSNLTATQDGVIHLYAVWNYTVTLKRNTATGDKTVSTVTCRYGTVASLPWMDSGLKWARTGYKFQGWGTGSSSAVAYANGAKATGVKTSTTLYAQWKPITYTVRYNRRNTASDTTTRDQVHTYDQPQGLLWLTGGLKWENAGFDFLGWATATNSTAVRFANGQTVTNLVSTQGAVYNLYAVWQGKPYTVRLNKNDGSGTKVSQTFRYHTAQHLPYKDSELHWDRAGYDFLGWARTATAVTAEFTNGESVTDLAAVGATIDLYAVWRAHTYTIVLSYNDGRSDLIREIPATYGQDVQLPWLDSGLKWTRVGHTFKGWATSSDSTAVIHANGAKVKNLSAINGAEVNLYAVWQ